MKVYDKTYSHNDILQKDVKDAKNIILKTHVIYIYISELLQLKDLRVNL